MQDHQTWQQAVDDCPDGVSPYGVYDTAGNLDEWVADWYDAFSYDDSPSRDPPGSEQGQGA